MCPHGALIGSICAFPGLIPEAPSSSAGPVTWIEASGWMLCDARLLYVAQYPCLFAVIGNRYGGDFPFFQLPDCRGMFLRGVDYGIGNDPDTGSRTGPGGDPKSEGVGSTQRHAIETHTHDVDAYEVKDSAATEGPGELREKAAKTQTSAPNLAAAASLSTKETRPVNLAVNYLIRVC